MYTPCEPMRLGERERLKSEIETANYQLEQMK